MNDLPKISLPNKKLLFYSVIFIVIVVLISSLVILGEEQINSQKAQVAALQQTIQKNNDQITALVKNNASQSAQIKTLLTQPTPTPVIETHYVSQSSTQNNASTDDPAPTSTLGETIARNVLKNAFEHVVNPGTITNCTYTGNGMSCTSN